MFKTMKKKYVKPLVTGVIYAPSLMETGSVQGVNGGNHTIGNGGPGTATDEVDSKNHEFDIWDAWEQDES